MSFGLDVSCQIALMESDFGHLFDQERIHVPMASHLSEASI